MALLTFIRNVIYNPTGSRVIYDYLCGIVPLLITSILFFIFERISIPLFQIIFFPLTFIIFTYVLGLYGRYKLSPNVMRKAILLTLAGLIPGMFFSLFHFSLHFIISVVFTIIFAIMPRYFFNVYRVETKTSFPRIISDNFPILIVGGGGYIGTYVVEKLLQRGYRVKVLDKFLYSKDVFKDLSRSRNLEIQEGDMTDLYTLTSSVRNTQAVIHLAGIVGDPAAAVDEKLTQHMNIISTRMLKETVKAFGVPKFVFASSCSVYGASNNIVNENSPLNPVSLYARTKIDSEKELLYDTFDAFHPVILRFATVFGHSRKPRFDLVTNLFVAQAFTTGTITVTGGQQWRPFIHVKDVAEAICKVIDAPNEKVSRQIFNVGDDNLELRIVDLAKTIKRILATERHIKILRKTDANDRRNYRVSFAKIKSDLNFYSSVTMDEGILEIYNHFKAGTYTKPFNDPYYSNLEMTKIIKKEFYSKKYRKTHISPISY